jgi:hypothetical protein
LSSGLLKIKKRNKNLILIKKNTPLEIFWKHQVFIKYFTWCIHFFNFLNFQQSGRKTPLGGMKG